MGHSRAGQQAGGLQAVEDRHADVHQDDVRPYLPGESYRGPPVPALARHLHVGLGADDGDQRGADQHLVVADQDPDRCAHEGLPGMRARTVKPPSVPCPALKSPPRTWTRSRSPVRPRPPPATEAAALREPDPSVLTSTVISLSPCRTWTEVRLRERT